MNGKALLVGAIGILVFVWVMSALAQPAITPDAQACQQAYTQEINTNLQLRKALILAQERIAKLSGEIGKQKSTKKEDRLPMKKK